MAHLSGAQLWIAGEGAERGRLSARILALGFGDRVRLLGAVPHTEMPRLLAAANVLALASTSEGLANVWVEALACGTPVVITDAGGARELIATDSAGRIAARTPEAFAAAIADLLAAPPTSDVVKTAAAPFSWEANTAALYDHLRGLVTTAQSSG